MKADFTPKEMVYNFIYKDKPMWVHNDDGLEELKIIDYVKLVPNSPIMMVNFHDGDVMEMNENKCYCFDVNKKLIWKKSTKKQIKASTENL